MVIVETVTEFDNMVRTVGDRDLLLYPILTDAKTHPAVNPVCVLVLSCDGETYVLPFNHNDATNLDGSLLGRLILTGKVYTPSKKALLHIEPKIYSDRLHRWDNIIDINSMEYLLTGTVKDSYEFLTPCHKKMYQMYDKYVKVNKSVPIMRHIETAESYFAHARTILSQFDTTAIPFGFLNDIAIPALQYLESNGVHVDMAEVEAKYGTRLDRYISDDLTMYTEYNPYTTTGRPSNKFGGVNFAALNKKDGSRKMFDSRFERGMVVMADYESFHLRLIADIIGYDLPTDIPIHEYLGRQYFNKEKLTEDEYNEGKQITFRLLYGEERDDNVPDFFKAVYGYIDSLAVLFDHQGYIVSPYYGRRFTKENIENPTPSKLFNYIVQLGETEVNLVAINKIRKLFDGKWSVPTLYTYDSILFDYNLDDGPDLLKEVIKTMSQDGKFPMRVYFGSNYDTVKRLNM